MEDDSTDVGNPTDWLGGLTSLVTAGTQVYGAVKGSTASNAPAQKTALATATGGNTLLYIGGGVLALILVVFLFMRGK